MSAPPSPAFSDISIPYCCSEEGADGNADSDYCSPEMKRAKRHDTAEPYTSYERIKAPTKEFIKSKLMSGVKESESRLSYRSVSDHKSYHSIEYDRNSSNHSLPTLDFKGLTLSNSERFVRRSSVDNVVGDRVDSHVPAQERRSLDENIFSRVGDEAELKNDRKTRVVSSYYNHFKEHQQLVVSDREFRKTGSSDPNRVDEVLEHYRNGASNDDDTGKGVLDKETVKIKFDFSEMTYESGEDNIRQVLVPAPLETLIGSEENYKNWSTSDSFLEDDAQQSRLKSSELGPEETETPQRVGYAGDSPTWSSHLEKEYMNELEFSTLVTLAYVRVRDLTNTINKAGSYLETIDKREGDELKETNELRLEIQAMFEERANLALEHSKWRVEISELYQQRKKFLSNLKSQAALAEQSYFTLRKELEDLQNEPVVTKPKRSWFSRLCGFIK